MSIGIYMCKEDVIGNGMFLSQKSWMIDEIMPFAATWLDREVVILRDVSNWERQIHDIAYIQNLEKS